MNINTTIIKEGLFLPYTSLKYPEITDPMSIPAKTLVAK